MDNRDLKPLLIIIPAALLIKLIYIFSGIADPGSPAALSIDALYHYRWAALIADGEIFANAPYFRAPFYPIVLGLLLKISGGSLQFVRLIEMLGGLAVIYFIYRLTLKIAGKPAAILAAVVYLLYPITTYFESELLLDPLFTLLGLASLYYLVPDQNGRIKIVPAGLFFGLAAITRPLILIFIPLVIYFLWRRGWRMKSPGAGLKAIAAFILLIGLIILPVTAINYIYSGQLILVSYQGGVNFYIGNNPDADGVSASLPPIGRDWQLDDAASLAIRESGKDLKYESQSRFWYGKGLEYIFSEPVSFLKLYLKKLSYTFTGREISNNRPLESAVFENQFLKIFPLRLSIILALAIIPLVYIGRQQHSLLPFYGIALLYGMTIALFFVNSRFRLPIVPLLAILAAVGIMTLFDAIRTKKMGRRFLLSLAAAATVFMVSIINPYSAKGTNPDLELYLRGNKEFRAGDYRAAIDDYDSLTKITPYLKNSYLNLGNAFLKTGDDEAALGAYHDELMHNSRSAEALNNIGVIHLLQNRVDSAFKYFKQSIEIKPYYLEAAVNLLRIAAGGTDSSLVSEIEAKRREFRRFLTDSPAYLFEEGVYLASQRRLAEAISSQLKVIELISSKPRIVPFETSFSSHSFEDISRIRVMAYYQLGYLYGLSGDFTTSVAYSTSAVSLDPGNKMAYINLISGYRSVGKNHQADSIADIYRQRWPEDFKQ